MKKLACLFPGIGYTYDKPLLYYSGKMLAGDGWEVIPVGYSGTLFGLPDDQVISSALARAEEILADVKWEEYGSILFVSKSLGTIVSGIYARQHGITCRNILFTPVESTFREPFTDAVAFNGTADPIADTSLIRRLCEEAGIPLYVTKGGNHSLETGNIDADIAEMRRIMGIVREFIG